LCAFVELFWYCEGYAPAHAKERVLPDGSLQIVISRVMKPSRSTVAVTTKRLPVCRVAWFAARARVSK
jgi:hypothetical protein